MMDIFTQDILEQAFKKVCQRRIKYSSNNDIWGLRINWQDRKNTILNKLNRNIYRFDAAKEVVINNEHYEIWSSEYAVVIEALTILLKEKYNITDFCTSFHLKRKGGVKAVVGKIRRNIKRYKYVMRIDVKKYYASIDHDRLLEILKSKIGETSVLSLLYQFMKRTVYKDGYYKTFKKEICRGTSLSPLLGALYLEELDVAMKNSSSFYIRYMDDIIVMSKNKWSFRRNIRKVNRILEELNLEKAEDKTFIGKIEKGFDFLGFYFSKEGMCVSKKAVRKFAKNIVLRLEEHSSSNEGKITPFRGMKKCL